MRKQRGASASMGKKGSKGWRPWTGRERHEETRARAMEQGRELTRAGDARAPCAEKKDAASCTLAAWRIGTTAMGGGRPSTLGAWNREARAWAFPGHGWEEKKGAPWPWRKGVVAPCAEKGGCCCSPGRLCASVEGGRDGCHGCWFAPCWPPWGTREEEADACCSIV
jgi:hypothetical protein